MCWQNISYVEKWTVFWFCVFVWLATAVYHVLVSLVSSQTSCESTQIALTIVKQSAVYASEEGFKVLAGESELYSSPILVNNEKQTFMVCLAPTTNNQYTLRAMDSYGDGWSGGSWIELKGPNNNVVLKTMMIPKGSGTYDEDFPFFP